MAIIQYIRQDIIHAEFIENGQKVSHSTGITIIRFA